MTTPPVAELWDNLPPLFRAVVEDGPLGWGIVDDEMRFLKFNRTFCRMLGYTEDELRGASIPQLTHPDDLSATMENWKRKVSGEVTSYRHEKRYLRKDGSVLWAILHSYRPAGGDISIGIVEDVTALHQTRDALRQSEDEQRRHVDREREARVRELRRSNEELRQYANVAAHDLQEPLRTMASFAELLSTRYRGRLDPEADEFLRFIVAGATRMRDLLKSLLRYSSVGRGQHPLVRVDAGRVFDEALTGLRAMIAESGAAITRDALPEVHGNEVLLGQVFQNLVANAIRYRGPAAPRAHLSVARRGSAWEFALRDNGTGFPPEQADRLFGMFQRLHRDSEGTGIGLAICKKIVEAHGGRIWAESSGSGGATFFFTIPET